MNGSFCRQIMVVNVPVNRLEVTALNRAWFARSSLAKSRHFLDSQRATFYGQQNNELFRSNSPSGFEFLEISVG